MSLLDTVSDILLNNKVGILSTCNDAKPFASFMNFRYYENHLYVMINAGSKSSQNLQSNRNVCILLGYEGNGKHDTYLEIFGHAHERVNEREIPDLWDDEVKKWIKEEPAVFRIHLDEVYAVTGNEKVKVVE